MGCLIIIKEEPDMKLGKKFLALLMALSMLLMACTASAEAYTAAAKGIGGDVNVTVTFENGKIAELAQKYGFENVVQLVEVID